MRTRFILLFGCVWLMAWCMLRLPFNAYAAAYPDHDYTLQDTVTVTISAVGDCTLGYDERENYHNSFADYYNRHTPDYFFENVAAIFAEDDLTIANCEGVLADSGEADEKTYIHRGDGRYADIFKRGNIDAVSLANNHTMDFFKEGFFETQRNLDRYGIQYFGRDTVCETEINGIRVGLLGYSGYTNGYKYTAKKDIEKMRADGVQLVIVSFHWGDDRAHYPNAIQFELGRFAIDCGADLVLGHHPHVIQGLELYKERYIVYSLGNFCYGGSKNPSDKDSFIYRQKFTFTNGERLDTRDIAVIPVRISSTETRNDYRPTPVFGMDARCVYRRLLAYNRPFGTHIPPPIQAMKVKETIPRQKPNHANTPLLQVQ